MRIGMFADCYHPIINGVVTSIHSLRQDLERLGHEVFLFVPGQPGWKEADPRVFRFHSVTFPLQPEERFSFPLPWKYVRQVPDLMLDCIHLNTPFNLGFLGLFISTKYNIPRVFTHHTLWEEYVHYVPLVSRRLMRKVARGLCRFFCNSCQQVIVPSYEVEKLLYQQGVRVPVSVVPTGIELSMFEGGRPELVRKVLGFSHHERILLFIGRMGKEKSLDFLIECFAKMSCDEPDLRLILVGDGPERPALERLVKSLSLEGRVIFAGYVPRGDLRHWYASAEVFVFGSTTETQGIVLVESMASGCPVVAVRASGSSEVVTDGADGFLTAFEHQAFVERVSKILHDKEMRKRMAEAAREKARTFSSSLMVKRAERVYQEAIAEGMKRPKSRKT